MFTLSIKLQSIASRNCAIDWNENQKSLYIKQSANKMIVFKWFAKLRNINMYQEASETEQMNMMIDDWMQREIHDNAIE